MKSCLYLQKTSWKLFKDNVENFKYQIQKKKKMSADLLGPRALQMSKSLTQSNLQKGPI